MCVSVLGSLFKWLAGPAPVGLLELCVCQGHFRLRRSPDRHLSFHFFAGAVLLVFFNQAEVWGFQTYFITDVFTTFSFLAPGFLFMSLPFSCPDSKEFSHGIFWFSGAISFFTFKSDGFGIWFGFFIRWEAWFWEGLLLVPLDHFLKACLFLTGVRSAPSCTQCPGSDRGWGSGVLLPPDSLSGFSRSLLCELWNQHIQLPLPQPA